jgi:hypothetical protein
MARAWLCGETGFERRFNKALSLERDAFVDAVGVAAPKPADSEAILAFDRGHSVC